MSNIDPNLELFEKYLNGELSKIEGFDFEKKLKDDPEFLEAFNAHKNLRKGIEWATISNSLEQVKRIHKAVVDDNLKLEAKPAKHIKGNSLSNFRSLAAMLLVGILATTIYFKVFSPTQDTDHFVNLDLDNSHLLYGTGGENIPLIDMLYEVKVDSIPSVGPGGTESILFQLFISDNEAFVIDTTALAVVLFTPYQEIVEAFEQKEFQAIYYHRTDESASTFQLVSEKAVFSLPMSNNYWTQLTKQ